MRELEYRQLGSNILEIDNHQEAQNSILFYIAKDIALREKLVFYNEICLYDMNETDNISYQMIKQSF